MLTLHNLKPAKGAAKKKKRVGRGNASGHGTYSGRGLKGQRARSGGKSGLKRLGMRHIVLQTPKARGFKSARPKNQVVRVERLNAAFADGATVTPQALAKAGLIKDANKPVKVLGNGTLTLKNLTFKNVAVSKSVAEQLASAT